MVLQAALIWYNSKVVVTNRFLKARQPPVCNKVLCHGFDGCSIRLLWSLALGLSHINRQRLGDSALILWQTSDCGTKLDLESVNLWRSYSKLEDLCRTTWTFNLIPNMTCRYYMDGYKQLDDSIGGAFLGVVEGEIAGNSQFYFADDADFFCRGLRDQGSKCGRP